MATATIIGAGPNGLTAAAILARAGVTVTVLEACPTIGGGTRTAELIKADVWHDVCSAFHPMGAASPVFASLRLEKYGLRWCEPSVSMAHPLADGSAGQLLPSLDATVDTLDDPRLRWLVDPAVRQWAKAVDLFLAPQRPATSLPNLLLQARIGMPSAAPAALTVAAMANERSRAVFAGVAAHVMRPLCQPLTTAPGVMLLAAGFAGRGWPAAQGGSSAITDALAAVVHDHGGVIETSQRVDSLESISSDVVLLDLSPRQALSIGGDRISARMRRALSKWKYGAAAFKVDYVIDGDVPWISEPCRRAGTVHLGGYAREIIAAERDVSKGILPRYPFTLVGQQYLVDPARSSGEHNPIWAYAHVPHNFSGDVTEVVTAHIEKYAPGFQRRIVGSVSRRADQWETYNTNYVGGDIASGANTVKQLMARPRFAVDPYKLNDRGLFICSQSTPPGAGVHGLCGNHAAQSALKFLCK